MVTVREGDLGADAPRLWGYCDSCSNWHYATTWYQGTDARCPVCAMPATAVEVRDGDVMKLLFTMEMPPGTVEPLLG